MDNAVYALRMAFAMILFVIALSFSMYMLNKTSVTAETLLYSADKTNFYDNLESTGNSITRIVSADAVISTLYRYYKENFCVKIYDATGSSPELIQTFDLDVEGKVTNSSLSKTDAVSQKLKSLYCDSSKPTYLFYAPWIGSTENVKLRVDLFVSGKRAYINGKDVNYTNVNFSKYNDEALYKFEETCVEYEFNGNTFSNDEGEIIVNGQKSNSKILIIYNIYSK